MSTVTPTKECAVQFESQVNGYTNQGTNDIAHFISNGLVVAWIDFDGNPGGNLGLGTIGGNITVSRIFQNEGLAYSSADSAIALSGWGNGSTVSGAIGYDPAFSFNVTASGVPAANPTITITFKNGSWGRPPQFLVMRNDINTPYWGVPHTVVTTATTLVITFNGTPTVGTTYSYICMGVGN